MQTFVDADAKYVISDIQPIQNLVSDMRHAAVKFPCIGDDSCGGVHDTLKLASCLWCVGQQRVAVVHSFGDERVRLSRHRVNAESDAVVAAERSTCQVFSESRCLSNVRSDATRANREHERISR